MAPPRPACPRDVGVLRGGCRQDRRQGLPRCTEQFGKWEALEAQNLSKHTGRLIEGTGDDKINIPGGLCVHHRDCKPGNCCFWCLVLDLCYASIGECKKECQGHIDARLFNLPSPSN
nr:uncharacterized protein LOC109758744 isoform X2 [Aegilops tauschii subsp. strangulata]